MSFSCKYIFFSYISKSFSPSFFYWPICLCRFHYPLASDSAVPQSDRQQHYHEGLYYLFLSVSSLVVSTLRVRKSNSFLDADGKLLPVHRHDDQYHFYILVDCL